MFNKIYLKSPIWLQEIFINIQGYRIKRRRFNPFFNRYLNECLASDLAVVDSKQLKVFLTSASKLPYWKEQFKLFNINLDANDLTDEIKKLPILSKKFVKENIEKFINKDIKDNVFIASTSGTTGSPLSFPYTFDMENKQWAIWTRYRRWHGITEKTWMGWLGGKVIVDIKQKKPPFWRTNYPMKQVMFSAYHLNQSTVHHYFNKLKKSKIEWIHGYPSQIALLASLINSERLGGLPDLKVITFGSESLLDNQRKIIQETFSVPIRQHYGLAEGVANISEDPSGNLVLDQDFCFTELVPFDSNDQDLCRIIGTNYNNLAFPLIRYDTGDVAHVQLDLKNNIEILSLDGRIEDYITLPDGTKLGRLANIFGDISTIKEAQIHQVKIDNIVIYIVRNKCFDDIADKEKILIAAQKKIGSEVELSIKFKDAIPRTKSGKFRFVISDIK